MEEFSRAKYIKRFKRKKNIQPDALKVALDIRKFEIELYWKRASYFWTFIAATFAGYFVLQQKENTQVSSSMFIVACLGFVFSFAWYFVNRGSKTWQRNWEIHVDLLENEVVGPLYKTTLGRYSSRFWDLTAGYPFSPSKINHLLGIFVIVVWFSLILMKFLDLDCTSANFWTIFVSLSLVIITCSSFCLFGRTRESNEFHTPDYRERKYTD